MESEEFFYKCNAVDDEGDNLSYKAHARDVKEMQTINLIEIPVFYQYKVGNVLSRTRRACISCMPTRIQCVSYVGIRLSFIVVGIPVKIARSRRRRGNDICNWKSVLLLGLGWSSYLVGGVMTPPYQVPNL